jgi:hypothetical protein
MRVYRIPVAGGGAWEFRLDLWEAAWRSGGRPFAPASRGTWIAAADATTSYAAWSERCTRKLHRIVVYDYRTGEIVASLPPSFQEDVSSVNRATIPWAFDLSSSGRLPCDRWQRYLEDLRN